LLTKTIAGRIKTKTQTMKNIITTTVAPTLVPTPMLESISLVESQRLIELEKVIEGGRQTFVEVGTALAEICDSRIYRSEHKSFDDYCRARWGWGKAYAYQLIGCAEVKKSPIGDSVINQAQAKELAKVPKTKRETVIKSATAKAKSAGRKLTARDIKVAAQPPTAPAIVNPDEPATVTKPAEAQPPSDLVNVAPKQFSTEDQLRLLWGKATPAERSSFLAWVKA
jgi:hypothetical protein